MKSTKEVSKKIFFRLAVSILITLISIPIILELKLDKIPGFLCVFYFILFVGLWLLIKSTTKNPIKEEEEET